MAIMVKIEAEAGRHGIRDVAESLHLIIKQEAERETLGMVWVLSP